MSDEKPTELDCTAFAMLTQIFWTMDGPFHTAVAGNFLNPILRYSDFVC